MNASTLFLLLGVASSAAGCATQPPLPPVIDLDEPVLATPIPESQPPARIVELPVLLPLPGQLKAIVPNPPPLADPKTRVLQANASARVEPTPDGYINAIQVWPFSAGALYQVYASPGKVSDIALQEGEELIAVSAGDTVRWVIGDTVSGSGATQRVHVLVKPTRAGLATNLVVMTNRRAYHLELTANERAWMASVSWDYPQDLVAIPRVNDRKAEVAAPVANGIAIDRLRFRYELSGDSPSWKPLRSFDDGEKVYIQFPSNITQGELPPLFVVGPTGESQLVNYRVRSPYYVVDRLFAAAELRLGAEPQKVVRITRNDGRKRAGDGS